MYPLNSLLSSIATIKDITKSHFIFLTYWRLFLTSSMQTTLLQLPLLGLSLQALHTPHSFARQPLQTPHLCFRRLFSAFVVCYLLICCYDITNFIYNLI